MNMSQSKIEEALKDMGLEISHVDKYGENGLVLLANKTYNIILDKKRVGCIVNFEFTLDAKENLESLTRKIVDVNPLIPELNETAIVDLKSNLIESFSNDSGKNFNFNILGNSPQIKDALSYIEDGGLGLANYESLLLINFLKGVEKRMIQIEKLLELAIQQNQKNESVSDNDQLLDVKGVAELLGLAIPTIHSKVNRNELPYMKRGKFLYFKKSEILEYLNRGKVLSNDEIELLARKKLNSNR
jgi:predicted DNA-binding transcriptional regulator AlpA